MHGHHMLLTCCSTNVPYASLQIGRSRHDWVGGRHGESTRYGPGTNRTPASGHVAFFSVWHPHGSDSCTSIPTFPNLDLIQLVQLSHSDHHASLYVLDLLHAALSPTVLRSCAAIASHHAAALSLSRARPMRRLWSLSGVGNSPPPGCY
jgi:hypothetical protein